MIEVSNAFATRWAEEWELALDMARANDHYDRITDSGHKRAIELFLTSFGVEILEEAIRYMSSRAPATAVIPNPTVVTVHSETLGDA